VGRYSSRQRCSSCDFCPIRRQRAVGLMSAMGRKQTHSHLRKPCPIWNCRAWLGRMAAVRHRHLAFRRVGAAKVTAKALLCVTLVTLRHDKPSRTAVLALAER
jgi:hypothetical protein